RPQPRWRGSRRRDSPRARASTRRSPCRSTSATRSRSRSRSKSDERRPQGRAAALADARDRPRRGDANRAGDLQPSLDARQLRRLAQRRLRMPLPLARRGAPRLLRADGRGAGSAPAQSLDRRRTPAPRSRQRPAARGGRSRAAARRAQRVPRSAAEQPWRAGAVHALRIPQDRHAAGLLPGARGSRRRAGADAAAGLTPVWRLRHEKEEAKEVREETGWIELKQIIPACTACGLHKTRTQTVLGAGDEQADWLFIGEAPGAEEDRLGEAFVGQAGKLLDSMLAAIGLSRADNVYICNVLKCRPPGNRNPEPEEVAKCTP